MKKYKEAPEIFEKIKNAKSILLALHRSPDPDSVGSNLAMYHALRQLGKEDITIISDDEVPNELDFIPGIEKIKKAEVQVFDFSQFELFLAIDTSNPGLFTSGDVGLKFPKELSIIVIDHHYTNDGWGKIALIDKKIGSSSEIIYNLFNSWKVTVTKEIAIALLAAIVGDTGVFRYVPGTTADTLKVGSRLIEAGASLKDVVFNLYQRNAVQSLKFWGKILENLKIEDAGKYKFAWSAIPYAVVREMGTSEREDAANMFFQGIAETDFGLVMVEEKEGVLRGSLRSRTGFNVAGLALALGGGGHKAAAGFTMHGDYLDSIRQVIETIKKIARGETESERNN